MHKFILVGLGATLLDNLDLEELADTAARLSRWEFMVVISPVRVAFRICIYGGRENETALGREHEPNGFRRDLIGAQPNSRVWFVAER